MKPQTSNSRTSRSEADYVIAGETLMLSFNKQETVINETIFSDASLIAEKEDMELQLSRLLLIYFKY